jgi:hypothetical protein
MARASSSATKPPATRPVSRWAKDRHHGPVFVTPRDWVGKAAWAASKRAGHKWKDVKAFDASDLEQWLERSVPVQAWMAEQLGIASPGILSLDECWEQWAKVTDPELSKELFREAVDLHEDKVQGWLEQPPAKPFVISADCREEALAFGAWALDSEGAEAGEFYDRAIALRSVESLKKATASSSNFIAVLATPEVELESAGLHKTRHTIIIRRRGAADGAPDVALDLLDHSVFRAALTAMHIADEEISRLAPESGQSLTILRRRLSHYPP